ncbi:SHOCT domain-containing protein [Nocardioides jiangxiensis]|uniref:SHOCT domain-containing protein n=1 Tax=Nocardioides jiangxiensis TaxID=3064524 RepID=A0ABT9AX15_9ACTN|nr:SHOCT domain-containing protein [Nocardioides sp. WY-20]MDO7867056.1 SHOCT domain-containing protein [Nocardioides sp. WY-20]
MMFDDYGNHAWAWMGLAMVGSVVVLVVAGIWLVELVAGWPWRDRDHPIRDEVQHLEHSPRREARRLLDERLARGEIDPEEYRSRRRALDE